MSHIPILTLENLSYGIGSERLFSNINLTIAEGDRLCLVGRNGAGKSTFFRILTGELEPDEGQCTKRMGLEISLLEQNPDFDSHQTLFDFAQQGLSEQEIYDLEAAFSGLDLKLDLPVESASGGERRKAALARLISKEADLWLLDEPTNHLDIASIEWLENRLAARKSGAFILISHDRRFLTRLSRGILWIDRKTLRRKNEGYQAFETWRDTFYEAELARWRKEDKFIEDESVWAIEGISARRKRNQGRLRVLEKAKTQAESRIKHDRRAEITFGNGEPSAKLVVWLRNAYKSYERPIFKNLNLKITRGEKIAIIGPNGAGKSTLVRILLGLEDLDQGSFRQGMNQNIAYFDQARARFKPDATLASALTDDPKLGITGQSDQIMVRGQPRHVYAYLKAFLFNPDQIRSPVSTLSGGERARLILAKIMAEESNVLVLDEPTNDLDVETLDLLEEAINEYQGTVILVSHDRDFVDRIATRTVFMDGLGDATLYSGGWSDLVRQGGGLIPKNIPPQKTKQKPKEALSKNTEPTKMSFVDSHRLERLPDDIARLEREVSKLEEFLSDPDLYNLNPIKFQKASSMLAEKRSHILELEEEWLVLEEKRSTLE